MSVHITVPKLLLTDDQMAFLTHQWRLPCPSSLFSAGDLGTSWSGTGCSHSLPDDLSSGWGPLRRDSTVDDLESM